MVEHVNVLKIISNDSHCFSRFFQPVKGKMALWMPNLLDSLISQDRQSDT